MALNVQIEAQSKDGQLWLLINGKRYWYRIDAAIAPKVEGLVRAGAFGKALNLVKRVASDYEKIG